MQIEIKDITYVSIQFILFGAYVLDVELLQIEYLERIGSYAIVMCFLGVTICAIALLQLNKYLSPFPTPKSNAELITNGIYRYIRHPIYSGLLLIVFGYGVYSNSIFRLFVSVLIYLLFYFKSKYEEERLLSFFDNYQNYKLSTGRFLPKF